MHSLVQKSLNQELKVVDISVEFLELVLNPKHGFGSNMNPCIDCKIFMLKKAKDLMPVLGVQFVVTGEVLGQRPMSQHRRALEIIEKESGLEGVLLRPLCAGILPQTLPEKEGWVKRDRLFKFSGRSRRPQIDLARELGIIDYPNASGGCLLTDAHFSSRLKDLISHQELNVEGAGLLKIGRHFRLDKLAKLIVGRNEEEGRELESRACRNDYLFMPDPELAGPTCLGKGEFNNELIHLASQITCFYCDLNAAKSARIFYHKAGVGPGQGSFLEVCPVAGDKLESLRL